MQVKQMGKGIQYVVDLTPEEAQVFLDQILNPKPNPAREATLKRALSNKLEMR